TCRHTEYTRTCPPLDVLQLSRLKPARFAARASSARVQSPLRTMEPDGGKLRRGGSLKNLGSLLLHRACESGPAHKATDGDETHQRMNSDQFQAALIPKFTDGPHGCVRPSPEGP